MPFALVTIGLIMIVSGAKDTHEQLGDQLVKAFTGPANFTYWLASIGVVGTVGYYQPFQILSRAFVGLILIVMVLRNEGLFDKLLEALREGPKTIEKSPADIAPNKLENSDLFGREGSDPYGAIN